ncbi:MAG: hypothetical protein ACI9O8_001459, partial [Patiriisocius sp.]
MNPRYCRNNLVFLFSRLQKKRAGTYNIAALF